MSKRYNLRVSIVCDISVKDIQRRVGTHTERTEELTSHLWNSELLKFVQAGGAVREDESDAALTFKTRFVVDPSDFLEHLVRDQDARNYFTHMATIGTDEYDGYSYFWNHTYLHLLRPATNKERKSVHDAFLDARIGLNGESDEHLAIIKRKTYPTSATEPDASTS
jgi:hypothetical protein